ncbi:SDR family NAD(P)-dependent oxidoreductase [Variovorax sp. YR216]|uniref:SDR family NAD(P)-dependent oxidoreductase n=1 Tax=Variovorax sp. YR216 TaxID=1882828 RepID=UPI00089BB389|nr:glucose 1-dehydrogenase [Variovorax sp. YR216]SEB25974.1 glucose 1-dehydrogenase [Variovorax sp. YR216]
MIHVNRLEGRVALVTGAGSGIGHAICTRLAEEGARIVALDRDAAAANATATAIGDDAYAVAADVANVEDMQRAVAEVVERFGRLDIAVNAAGVGASSLLVDTQMETWQRVMDVCLTGVFVSSQAQARQMIAQGGPAVIVNIASTNAQQPGEGLAAYCAAKAGVDMLSRVAALELAPYGIRVAAVGPGLTDTPMVARLLANPSARDAFLDNIPAGRPARPEDIAAAVAFLASDDAAYVTGQTLYVDGGASMMRYPSLASRRAGAAA